MYFASPKTVIFISGFIGLQAISALAVPEFRTKLSGKVFYGPVSENAVTVDFRRDVHAAAPDGTASTTTPAAIPEARCGSYVYNSDYIKKTLTIVSDLQSKGAKAGTSDFPKPFGTDGKVMIYPLLRNDQIFDGTANNQPGPDRLAVGIEGMRYSVFTAEGQMDPENSTNFQTCEYLMPENAQIEA
ncbi:putative csep0407 effector protein [Erysiphe neolycopersici]|uniref:Putative csep0407 effector protein n=1 Tax=Erysiphe neolycopersici TaxID=212602 RepID=A0A420HA94_9PEZI|nr:putative csep0407 effector protein [Erysiphe neolycopersici]